MQLVNTAAIVTGGASGLGAATAAALVKQGARVFAFDLPQAVEAAPAVDGVEYVATDVTDEEQVRAAVATAAGSGMPLRTVVNCAGIGPSMRILGKKGVHDLAFYAKVVQVNLVGPFNVMALAAEKIAETDPDEQGQRGVIINTASIAAYDGQVGQAAYSSSKGGIVGLNLPAARDLAQYGIRVNTIAPGIVETPMLATVSEEFRAGLAFGRAVPAAPGPPRRVRPARARDRRPRLPQRRGHPDGRRAAHGAALTHRAGRAGTAERAAVLLRDCCLLV
jgi:NAD(P)-dependent dehydrogenase (short-subunit alcohol dehydrogenase family)